ncbi:MAG: TRAP transporter small permease subunit [Burkholderiaceae bacterium]
MFDLSIDYDRRKQGPEETLAGLEAVTDLLLRINTALLLVCKYLIMVIVAVIAAILIAGVVYRYGLNNALSWAEELSKYLMVWLAFLGAPIALRRLGHINIDLFVRMLPDAWSSSRIC